MHSVCQNPTGEEKHLWARAVLQTLMLGVPPPRIPTAAAPGSEAPKRAAGEACQQVILPAAGGGGETGRKATGAGHRPSPAPQRLTTRARPAFESGRYLGPGRAARAAPAPGRAP